ncbi:uncharacterized mitochondrial protein AtMg00310-like [Salvia miltiorrhiza]|uniref:uncharacterized mitochondrial protein AtMg00310-like n=1 Tax=Salvia miltiorrhiza TaxID=226208 RepID=UPI0025ABD95C|nr:uncharacterized mitochondrial protein AtMg00310-like [Salvia miltiorrhiza]
MDKGDGGLGFRDITPFNKALLAKQAWRLLTNEFSFIARSLKARYYPRKDFLLARNAHNPSFVWKSILGRELLEAGVAWKIGNGERIRIGTDPWLPKGNGLFEVVKVADEAKYLNVKSLLDDDGSSWDLRNLEETLNGDDRWRVMAQLRSSPHD